MDLIATVDCFRIFPIAHTCFVYRTPNPFTEVASIGVGLLTVSCTGAEENCTRPTLSTEVMLLLLNKLSFDTERAFTKTITSELSLDYTPTRTAFFIGDFTTNRALPNQTYHVLGTVYIFR